jgi:hypothetical protein
MFTVPAELLHPGQNPLKYFLDASVGERGEPMGSRALWRRGESLYIGGWGHEGLGKGAVATLPTLVTDYLLGRWDGVGWASLMRADNHSVGNPKRKV